ncbi:MAG: hypothetical protein LWY06_16235 [Firmicutes bacterium]|nr:hypothetical protein [Bacillota bacterium]
MAQIICPRSSGHMRGGIRSNPLVLKIPKKTNDTLWTWYSEFLITENTRQIFEKAGFTGYILKPVEISGYIAKSKKAGMIVEPERLPILWEVVITGWAGLAPLDSGVNLSESRSCSECGYLSYSMFTNPAKLILESQWDKSDFFIVWPLPKFIFVTERVVKLFEQLKLKGTDFIPVDQLEPAKTGNETLSPGRLSYWMPDDRAHQLGDPLGIY